MKFTYNYKNTPKGKKGFTLLELMITISIIVILSGILLQVINPSAIRAKARDEQRRSDLARIGAALELYFSENRAYPVQSTPGGIPSEVANYMNPIPTDPLNSTYTYVSDAVGGVYCLGVEMEMNTSANACSQTACSSVGLGTNPYCITNP